MLEMDTSGKITNSEKDYTLDKNGLSLVPDDNYKVSTSITWGPGVGIGAYKAGSVDKIQHKSDLHDFTDANNNLALQIQTGPSGSRVNVPGEVVVNTQLTIPTYNNATRPDPTNLSDGVIILNTDEGTIQYAINGHWEETK